ncbi:MAG TPA: PIG-L family deacetylase [Anaerolineae bacterium]|nr:PIG-L family deacetylase [Anaerolineae bacterium]
MLSSRSIKRTLSGVLENFWSLGFVAAGHFDRRTVDRLISSTQQRILIVAPHPDDEVIGCAGTLKLQQQFGAEACVVYATDGRRSRAQGLSSAEMANRRKQEADAALRQLQIAQPHWLGLVEGEWTGDQFTHLLDPILRNFQPHIIYAPSLIDYHPEHKSVAQALARTLKHVRSDFDQPIIRIYQVHVPLTSILVNVVADVSRWGTEIRLAGAAYVTQTDSIHRADRIRRYAAAYYRAGSIAEEFWQMSADRYIDLHLSKNSSNHFRGVRYWAWSDPLAYGFGRNARQSAAKTIR